LAGARIITLVFVSIIVFTQVSILSPTPQFPFNFVQKSAKVKLITVNTQRKIYIYIYIYIYLEREG
jgi:hypothetical protein